jgi:DNA replication protein DnaC
VVIGNPGTGKTYLASAILAYALRHFNTVRYWKEEFLFNHLRKSIDEFGDYITTLQLATDDDFCVIDDVGSTPVNDWRKEIIFNAMDIRYGTALPTLITSNLTREQISKKYDPRTADRIFAKENTIIELFDAPSLRTQGL